MEPAQKKARLTDHFRVALRPRDLNVAPLTRKQAKQIEVITIGDDNSSQRVVGSTRPLQETRRTQQQQKCDENKTLQQSSQQQTQPLKLVTFSSQQPQQQNTLSQQKQPLQQQQQQPRQRLGPIVLNNNTNIHGRASKGNRSSITSCSNNDLVNLANNKSITSYLIKHQPSPLNKYLEPPGKQTEVFDYDKTLLSNVCWEPHYAWESFEYDRQQEIKHKNTKPLYTINNNNQNRKSDHTNCKIHHTIDDCDNYEHNNQVYILSSEKRAELVDWLVDIQINFDLDHEPLYMAVKLVDQYLMRKQVRQGDYELLFMVSMLIAAKFDERIPPITIAELIHVTKTRFGIRYTRKQVISFEVDLLTTLEFDIRFPLSYGFLRRFARCTRSDTRTLYLARYILESSLMDQGMIEVIESKLAAGSLLLAFNMLHKNGAWDETARYYTGYDEQELHSLTLSLNRMILRLSKRKTAIKRKYSHEPYMEVARIPID